MRARIKPLITKSQYSQSNNLQDGYAVITESGTIRRFNTRREAEQHIISKGYTPAYTVLRH